MWIKKREYDELNKRINNAFDSLSKHLQRIEKLEFKINNSPKYKIGDTVGNWKVHEVIVKTYGSLFFEREYLFKYKCINCKDNKIQDFTEEELGELK
jgi:hypothetical protein